MGIRFEKGTLMQWQHEMAKHLRLLVDKYEALADNTDIALVAGGYREFFDRERSWMLGLSVKALRDYADRDIAEEQIRPLALLFLHDALLLSDGEEKQNLLKKAKFLLEYVSEKMGSFSFEDYNHLILIDSKLGK